MADLYLMKISEADKLPEELCTAWFPQRFERSKGLIIRDAALRSIAAGALVAGVLGARESDISFGKWGKPYLAGGERFFSLSHSGEYALLAVNDCDIGCDIEAPGICRSSVANRFFTDSEQGWMKSDPDSRFFEIWTAKESLQKLDGRGLSLRMESFSALELICGRPMSFGGRQVFGCTALHEGYRICACAYEKLAPPMLCAVSAEDMIGMIKSRP